MSGPPSALPNEQASKLQGKISCRKRSLPRVGLLLLLADRCLKAASASHHATPARNACHKEAGFDKYVVQALSSRSETAPDCYNLITVYDNGTSMSLASCFEEDDETPSQEMQTTLLSNFFSESWTQKAHGEYAPAHIFITPEDHRWKRGKSFS